jgi:hypothetical protein
MGDVGIIVLDEKVSKKDISEYAALPAEGLVDTLATNTPVDYVGYGVQIDSGQRSACEPDCKPPLCAPGALISGSSPSKIHEVS